MAYKVFISHAHDHFALFDSLVSRLNRARFDWVDRSVPYQRRHFTDQPASDDEIKKLLSSCIDDSDVVIVIAKPVISRRPWIRWELEYAKSAGKPVLTVWRRQVDRHVSKYARDCADMCIDTWNIASIIRAIETLAARPRLTPGPGTKTWPELSELPVTDEAVAPAADLSSEPLAPEGELALAPGETTTAETPREVLGPIFKEPPQTGRIPRHIISPPGTSEPGVLPKTVIVTSHTKRRWWQFWRSREAAEARSS